MSRLVLSLGVAAVALTAGAATPAFAQSKSKFDITIGGDAFFEAGITGQDRDSGLRATEFRNRLRLVVTPVAKADNGLEYGGRIRLVTDPSRSMVSDRAFMFVNGGFGTVSAGQQNGLSDEYAIIAPSDWGTGGVDGDMQAFLGGTGSNLPGTAGNLRTLVSGNVATRITYLTPKFSGFQFGVTYQPTTDSQNTDINRRKTAAPSGNLTGAYSDVYEVGGNYAGTFGDVSLGASLYYLGGTAKNSSTSTATFENLSSTMAGLSVGYGGFKVGGSYAWSGKSGYAKRTTTLAATSREAQNVWTLGGQYTVGAITVGATYLNAQDAGSLTVAGKNQFQQYVVGAKYVIAPGLSVGGEYNYFKLNSDVAANKDKGNVVLFTTNLAF
ncbi:porin [Azospirillum griseum]|uniref:Porin n=1 Tax=Azospirillum griseum TaxID=2496639 RepID=A0A431VLZ6_9PROT|nr:porin [Azospirillum griseum]RTR22067.1 porin [Azospirillum griseum]